MNVRAVAVLATLAGAVAIAATASAGSSARVLRVGSWQGKKGQFTSIASAVRAARPGDWILVAPGDYRERPGSRDGVRITKPDLHIRGMSRSGVIVDGTRPGAPGPCAAAPRWQNLGPGGQGRNGIVVVVSGVSIQNLTVCNFVGGRQSKQIAFDGGFGSGKIGLGSYTGSYLTATSTFVTRVNPALYGIFASNASGPGRVTNSFASNMADSAFHIGGCTDCRALFGHDTAEHSVIAFTAIDAGGRLVVESSTFRDNTSGIDLASEEDESSPPPQDGACPDSPRSCTLIRDNLVEDNNDPNVPGGEGGVLRFIGAGILVAGGRHDTIAHNTIRRQGAYGVVVTPYPWLGRPPTPGADCQGGKAVSGHGPPLCFFAAYGNHVTGNHLSGNGTFGNRTNGDYADATKPGGFFGELGVQIACATGAFGSCAGTVRPVVAQLAALGRALHVDTRALTSGAVVDSTARYPGLSHMTAPMAPPQPSMPDPCAGVPSNPWCPS